MLVPHGAVLQPLQTARGANFSCWGEGRPTSLLSRVRGYPRSATGQQRTLGERAPPPPAAPPRLNEPPPGGLPPAPSSARVCGQHNTSPPAPSHKEARRTSMGGTSWAPAGEGCCGRPARWWGGSRAAGHARGPRLTSEPLGLGTSRRSCRRRTPSWRLPAGRRTRRGGPSATTRGARRELPRC